MEAGFGSTVRAGMADRCIGDGIDGEGTREHGFGQLMEGTMEG